MPVYVFTYHAYQSWLPDHPRGYVKRGNGVLPTDEAEAERYREVAQHEEFCLSEKIQKLLIDEAQRACHFQKLRLHFVATEPTHVHVLVSWEHTRSWEIVRDSVKSSLTRAIRKFFKDQSGDADRPYFSRGSSRKRIRTRQHLEHWMNQYGPSHSGWKWCEGKGEFH